jgi:hypothetical protein
MHNFADDKTILILQNTVSAMERSYSKVLILDVVVPPTGASVVQTTQDMAMMALLSAKEKTKKAWQKLLAQVGLKVIKWWDDACGFETLIEAELA